MKLQGTTSEKGEKEQETKGKGTHTARAGRDDGRGWEDDLPQAEERKGAWQRICVATALESIPTASLSRALRGKGMGNKEDRRKGQCHPSPLSCLETGAARKKRRPFLPVGGARRMTT